MAIDIFMFFPYKTIAQRACRHCGQPAGHVPGKRGKTPNGRRFERWTHQHD